MSAIKLPDPLSDSLPERETWRVTDLSSAAWAVEKVAALDANMAEVDECAQANIERWQNWRDEEKRKRLAEREWFVSLLAEYHRAELAKDERKRTIKFPHGETRIRAQQPEFVRDDKALLAWAEQNRPEVVERKPAVKWSELKQALAVSGNKAVDAETGEEVAGIVVIARPDKFDVKTKEE